MLHYVTNSRILNASLKCISEDEQETIIQMEFKKMCERFNLTNDQMISLITTLDISLLDYHYDTIWESFNYYSMECMDDFKDAYIQSLYKSNLNDPRIELLCDDMKEYIKQNSCINSNSDRCTTFKKACDRNHDECVKYLLNNPACHDSKNDKFYANGLKYPEVSINNSKYRCSYGKDNIVDYICMCNGSLNVIKYLFEVKKKDRSDNYENNSFIVYNNVICHCKSPIDWMCKYGKLDVVRYLFEVQKKDCTNESIEWAIEGCHFDIIKYLFEVQNKKCTEHMLKKACLFCGLDIVEYLFEKRQRKYSPSFFINSIAVGNLDVLKYLYEKQSKNILEPLEPLDSFEMSFDKIGFACSLGHFDIVKYLFEVQQIKDCNDTNSIDSASVKGHIDIVKYLFEVQNKNCTTNAIDGASRNGHMDTIKYLFEVQNKDCTSAAIDGASENGHLDVVKYLFEVQHKDCTTDAIDGASRNGHMDTIKYLFEVQHKDCTFDAMDGANTNGHPDIVKYLFEMHKLWNIYSK